MTPTLVLQAYGTPTLRRQARFALDSWLYWLEPSTFRVVLFTDAPDEFAAALPASLEWIAEPLDAARLKAWRGRIDFVHRVKIEALCQAATRCNAPLLYLDGDTACIAHPEPLLKALAAGRPLMHTFEGHLATSAHRLHRKIWRRLRQTEIVHDGKRYVVRGDTPMWNAGVVGLAARHLPLLADVLALTDAWYPLCPKHVIEQLAFSFRLDQAGPIEAAESCILHYWRQKATWDQQLATLYATHPQGPLPRAAVAALLAHPPQAPKRRRPWWRLF